MSYGQSFPSFADHPEWTYSYGIFGVLQTPIVIRMPGEVTICDQTWNRVTTNNASIGQWPDTSLVGYTRTVGDKTFFRHSDSCSRPEWLIFDFSLSLGDTFQYRWHYAFDTTDAYAVQFPMVVTQVNWLDYGGIVRKTIRLEGVYNDGVPNYLTATWIEGLGAMKQPFSNIFDTDFGFSEVDFWLICAQYHGLVIFASPFPQSVCTYRLTRYHVKHDVVGGANDGSTWANAFRRLEDAIAVAGYGDTIWVARGTYYPTTTGDKTAYFELKNGVSIIGGFAGTETHYAQRTPQDNETILSGDLGVPGDWSENSFHVVYTLATDSTSLLEGFTIAYGNADSTLEISHWAYGGGMVILPGTQSHYRSAPRLRHCRFVDNRARYGGGLAYFTSIEQSARADVQHCRFQRNKARNSGGGLLWQGTAPLQETQIVTDCVFEDGYAFWGGGGMAVHNATANFLLERCIFERDSCHDGGGGFQFTDLFYQGQVTLKSCRFGSNYGNGAGGIAFFSVPIYEKFTLRVEDSEFLQNVNPLNGGGAIYCFSSGDSTIIQCEGALFEGNRSNFAGGAMSIMTLKNNYSFVNFSKCQFNGNRSNTSWGGALYIWGQLDGPDSHSYTEIENCLFTGNRGAIGLTNGQGGVADMHIRNSTFYNNGNPVIAKPWQETFSAYNYARITLANTVLWEPGIPFRRILSNNSPYHNLNMYRLDNCLISAGECPDLPDSEQACGQGMLYGLDPLFADSAGGDFRPLSCSPLIDAGDNQWLEDPASQTDLAGLPRIRSGTVDIGAYEGLAFRAEAWQVIQHPACHDSADGAISISITDDQPFSAAWLDAQGQQGTGTQNLAAGEYFFFLTDTTGCADTLRVLLDAPDALQTEVYILTPVSGPGNTDGVAAIGQITGGTPPYLITWSNGAVAHAIGGLLSGEYAVTVTDANGCSFTLDFTMPTATGVKEEGLQDRFLIVPNPSGRDGVQIWTDIELSEPVHVEVLDAFGRRVSPVMDMNMSARSLKLPSDLPPGMYVVLLTDTHGQQVTLKWVCR